jgi:hypothetical protein
MKKKRVLVKPKIKSYLNNLFLLILIKRGYKNGSCKKNE